MFYQQHICDVCTSSEQTERLQLLTNLEFSENMTTQLLYNTMNLWCLRGKEQNKLPPDQLWYIGIPTKLMLG